MKKRILAFSLVLVMIALLCTGCGQKPSSDPVTAPPESSTEPVESTAVQENPRAAANEITIGIAQDFDSLDPDYMTAAGTKEILFNVFEGLVKPNSDGEIVPAVASEIVKSDDGLSYAFTLREGVKFHNGNPVEMQDLVYSLE